MEPVTPVAPGSELVEVMLGADQPQYRPLPAIVDYGPKGAMVTRWRPTEQDRKAIAGGADIILTQLTFRNQFQPVNLDLAMPDEMPWSLEIFD